MAEGNLTRAASVPLRFSRDSYPKAGMEKEYVKAVAAVHQQIPLIIQTRRLSKKVRLEMGRLCIALKNSVHHGLWRDCYEHHFGRSGVTLDRAREYLRKADKKGNRRLRGAADRGGPEAQARRAAARKEKEESERRREQKTELDKNLSGSPAN